MTPRPALPSVAELQDTAREHLKSGRFAAASAAYREVLARRPDDCSAHVRLAYALREDQQLKEAEQHLRAALALDATRAEVYHMLGQLLRSEARLTEAIDAWREALRRDPDFLSAYPEVVLALMQQGDLAAAKSLCQDGLARDQGAVALHLAMANICRLEQRDAEAVASFRRVLQHAPDHIDARIGLGIALQWLGQHAQGLTELAEAVARHPQSAVTRWAFVMAHLPSPFEAPTGDARQAAAFLQQLEQFDQWARDTPFDETQVVGQHMPFLLAYRPEDHRQLLSDYGASCQRMMQRWQDRQGLGAPQRRPRGARQRLKIGIASAHFCDHSVWHAILKGWIETLDARRFEVHAFHLGHREDAQTQWARTRVAFFDGPGGALLTRAQSIRAAQLDVLLYDSVAMHPLSMQLASLRLAPVQAVSWGHPQTTGLPTLDYYLSAALFEPPEAQQAYCETLIALPGCGTRVARHSQAATPPDLTALGIERDQPLLICPGTPFKYAPADDALWVHIAKRLGRCQMVFFTAAQRSMSEQLRERLHRAFAAEGLEAQRYCRFIAWQSSAGFRGLLAAADVFIDTLGFSGFNTALQAAECSLPIATCEAPFMRGRLAAGILRQMHMGDLVMPDRPSLVQLIWRLVNDAPFAQATRQRMRAEVHRLFDDSQAMSAFAAFLDDVARAP